MRRLAIAIFLAAILGVPVFLHAQSPALPAGAFAKNVEFVSYTDENGHIPFKLTIQEVKGRWYLYTASLYDRGWSILDVTDPAKPTVVNWIPGPANTFTVQVDMAEGKMITALERSQFGGDTDHSKPWDEGVLIWNVEDPVHPELLGHFKTGGLGTHRDGYYGGRYMHLASGANGFAGNIYVIADISDPAHPVEVSRWWLPEQKLADPNAPNTAFPHGFGLHGPPVVVGNLAYLSYGKKFVILDISDVRHPKEVSEVTFDPPFHLGLAVHTALPFPARKIVETNSETFQGACGRPQPGFSPRRRRSRAAQNSFVPSRAHCSARRALRRLLPQGRQLRLAQREHALPQSFRRPLRQHSLPHLFQRRPAHLRHFERLSAAGNRLLHSARSHQARPWRSGNIEAHLHRRRRARRHPRLHLSLRLRPGPLHPALHRTQAPSLHPRPLIRPLVLFCFTLSSRWSEVHSFATRDLLLLLISPSFLSAAKNLSSAFSLRWIAQQLPLTRRRASARHTLPRLCSYAVIPMERSVFLRDEGSAFALNFAVILERSKESLFGFAVAVEFVFAAFSVFRCHPEASRAR